MLHSRSFILVLNLRFCIAKYIFIFHKMSVMSKEKYEFSYKAFPYRQSNTYSHSSKQSQQLCVRYAYRTPQAARCSCFVFCCGLLRVSVIHIFRITPPIAREVIRKYSDKYIMWIHNTWQSRERLFTKWIIPTWQKLCVCGFFCKQPILIYLLFQGNLHIHAYNKCWLCIWQGVCQWVIKSSLPCDLHAKTASFGRKPVSKPRASQLTHWDWNKMAAIFQITFSNTFSRMKICKFQLRFHWSLFLSVQSTIN